MQDCMFGYSNMFAAWRSYSRHIRCQGVYVSGTRIGCCKERGPNLLSGNEGRGGPMAYKCVGATGRQIYCHLPCFGEGQDGAVGAEWGFNSVAFSQPAVSKPS